MKPQEDARDERVRKTLEGVVGKLLTIEDALEHVNALEHDSRYDAVEIALHHAITAVQRACRPALVYPSLSGN